ncbi:MAG TPA: hypothetical protein VMS88_08225 [Terriglobales bacterium]|nr:hypothetical protein [Terriglobales bacterium]
MEHGKTATLRSGRAAWLVLFSVAVLASRLPLLGPGYGSDDDAWRNAVAAVRMRELGRYVPSRVPGFPVFERITAALVPWGWRATNAASIVAGLAAALLFFLVAERLRVRSPRWLALAFAFVGGMWVATAQTMDYAFGIALLLGTYLALLAGRHLGAGCLLALAAGCRVSNGALLASAALFLLLERRSVRAWAAFLGSFLVTALVVFVPVALSPEIGNLRGHAAKHISRAHVTAHTLVPVLRQALVFSFGKAGTVVLALALVASLLVALRSRPAMREPVRNAPSTLAFEASAAILIGVAFLLVPYEHTYLLPALPFVLLLAARALPRPWIAALAIVFAAECLVVPVLDRHRLAPGRIFLELGQRRADMAETRELAALRPDPATVYVVGRFRVHRLMLLDPGLARFAPAWVPFQGPGLALLAPGRRIAYAATLTPQQTDSLAKEGYRIVRWPPAEAGP